MNYIEFSLIFLITLILSYQYSKIIKIRRKRAIKIFLWHSIFCLVFTYLSAQNQLDSYGYYINSLNNSSLVIYSNNFIIVITSIFSKILGLNFYSCSLIYSLIGAIGVITMDSIITPIAKISNQKIRLLFELLIWSPTLHFWTSSIGKDAIIFTSINLILYSLIKPRKRFLLLIPCFLLIAIIRPYIGIVLVISIISSTFVRVDIPKNYKVLIRLIIIFGFSYFITAGIDFLKLKDGIDFNSVSSLLEYHRDVTETGTHAVDMDTLNVPLRLFTYMFRPLFFDAKGFLGFLASLDNLILLSIFIYPIIISFTSRKFPKLKFNSINVFLILYISINWFFLASTTSNLGLALRHKLMFITPFAYASINATKTLQESKYLGST